MGTLNLALHQIEFIWIPMFEEEKFVVAPRTYKNQCIKAIKQNHRFVQISSHDRNICGITHKGL